MEKQQLIIKTLLICGVFFLGHKVTAQQAAICMLLVKVARLKNKRTEDCYIDMAGYAAIAGEIQDKVGWKNDEDEGTRREKKKDERCPHN